MREKLAVAEKAHGTCNRELELQKEDAESEARRLEIERSKREHQRSSLELALSRLDQEVARESAGTRPVAAGRLRLEDAERAEERRREAQDQLEAAQGDWEAKLVRLQSETDLLIGRRGEEEKSRRIDDLIAQIDGKSHELNELKLYQEELENRVLSEGHKDKLAFAYERNAKHLFERQVALTQQKNTLLDRIDSVVAGV